MLRFQFLFKMKNAFVHSLVAINLMMLKISAYLLQHLNTSYRQEGLTFLFE